MYSLKTYLQWNGTSVELINSRNGKLFKNKFFTSTMAKNRMMKCFHLNSQAIGFEVVYIGFFIK